jgi:hypothetical protein
MSIIERIKRFLRRQSEAPPDPRSEQRLDAMVKAQERDKRV